MFRSTVAAALLLAAATCAVSAEPAPDDAASPPWYKRMFGSSSKEKPAPTPAAPATNAATPQQPAPTWKDVSRSLDQERAVYLERMQYCTRLRQIAFETKDDELSRKADELDAMAWDVYQKRTQSLPTIVQDVKAAEAVLDQRRPSGPPAGSASAAPMRMSGRSANGRPIYTRE